MSIRKKQFPCGHKGLGRFCHACAQEEAQRLKDEQEDTALREAKAARVEGFLADPIDLRLLPHEPLIQKARQILRQIAATQDYRPFFGKRMEADRTVLSVPLNYRYRLLFRIHPDRIEPLSIMSHETYNHAKDRLCA